MYIFIALTLFIVAILFVLLSYTPWVQENIKWMTNFYFYIAVGAMLGVSLLIAAYNIAQKMIPLNQ